MNSNVGYCATLAFIAVMVAITGNYVWAWMLFVALAFIH